MESKKGKGKKRIVFTLPSEDFQLLKKKIKDKGVSLASYVRMLVLEKIKEV